MKPPRQVVLCFDIYPRNIFHSMRIEGIRRFARLRDWSVEFFTPEDAPPDSIRALLARHRPVGCLVECSHPNAAPPYELPPPQVFGGTPVVYIDPPEDLRLRNVAAISCDNVAVARMAFRELSADHPPAYAAVPFWSRRKWSDERIATFRAICAGEGKECLVFPYRAGEGSPDSRQGRLADWLAALPPHCAIFAVNDRTAWDVSCAFRAIRRPVPRSATFVGVDGNDEWPDASPSRISSVKLDFDRSGFVAARLLSEQINPKARRSSRKPPVTATFGPLCVLRRESTRGRGRRDPRILEAAEIIRREADSGLTVATLAERFGCSRRLFEIRFREAMGHSAIDEILHVRLEHAQALMARGDMPVAAIADFCGFGTDRQMHRVFRSRTGMSPREWRKANCL